MYCRHVTELRSGCSLLKISYSRETQMSVASDARDMNLSEFRVTVEDTGAWLAVVNGVAKSQIQLSN